MHIQPLHVPLAQTVSLFWRSYLWHHRHPLTRTLHQIGSWVCLFGLAGAIALGKGWLLLASIAIGYAFAFAGHYLVEHNKPLTFTHPILAGLCNWRLFWLELTGGLQRELLDVEEHPPVFDIDTGSF